MLRHDRASRWPAVLLPFFVIFASSGAWAGNLRCQILPSLFSQYLKHHYSIRAISDEVKAHTIEQFVKTMDPSKTLLLEADATRFQKDLLAVFDQMGTGNCALLESFATFVQSRAEEDLVHVRSVAGPTYKLDESVEMNIYPDKRGYPKTAAERLALLTKLVHFQMSNYLLADVKLEEAKKQLIHRYELIIKRMRERKDKGDLVVHFAESFALALDPHSSFLSQDELDDFRINMGLSLEGIGASLSSQDGFTVVEDLIPGGSADRMKVLKPKDKIIAVAQDGQKPIPVIDMDLKDVVKMIRGRKNTRVKLTILRQGESTETFDVTIVRDKVDIKDQAAKITYQTRPVKGRKAKIGVIELPSFYGSGERDGRSGYADIRKLLEEAKREKVEGIVLNLSRNGGGLLDDAVRISGLFLRKGGVVATKDSEKRVEILADEDEGILYSGPLVVLTSRLSASASEIFAGAMKDYKRAVIVGGDHTYGKGTVQVLSQLPSGLGAMKVTTGMFFIPSGRSTQHEGVASDIVLPSTLTRDDLGEKTMDYSLPSQTVEQFVSDEANLPSNGGWKPLDAATLQKLAAASKSRVEKELKFIEIRKEIDEEAKTRGWVKLSELKKKAKKEDKSDGTRKKREEKLKDLDAPLVNEGVNILADLLAS